MKSRLKSLRALPIVSSATTLLCLTPPALHAQFDFVTNNGAIMITEYTGPGGDVVIPSETNGLPVTTIGDSAFYYCVGLTNVTIGNSVMTIGDYAFNRCTRLASITIPDSVTTIGSHAFYSCASLPSVAIPNSVTNLGRRAFGDCASLSAITVDPENRFYSSIDGVLFDENQTTLIRYPGGRSGSYTIPEGVIIIGDEAFNNCTKLTNVAIGISVTTIEGHAFAYCTTLSAITVDPHNPFYSSIDGVLFSDGQTALIRCPEGRAGSYTITDDVIAIGDEAFFGCTSLTNITIPDSVASIGEFAFYQCRLTTVTIPDNVTTIPNSAFNQCTRLTSITIPDSVTNIGYRAFAYCINLTEAYFQANAPSIDASAFTATFNVTVYYLPGTAGWDSTFGGRPTAIWQLPYPVILNVPPFFGLQSNQFGFRVSWATNASVVVDACTNVATPLWSPAATNNITMGIDPATDGWTYFSDPDWTNCSTRFYRIRSP